MRSIAAGDDPLLLLAAAAAGAAARVDERIRAAGFTDLRPSHTALFAALAPSAPSVRELAGRLGISPQAASKAVLELERLGYLHRDADRRIALTERGEAAVQTARESRAQLRRELDALLGDRAASQLRRLLRVVASDTGGYAAMDAARLLARG